MNTSHCFRILVEECQRGGDASRRRRGPAPCRRAPEPCCARPSKGRRRRQPCVPAIGRSASPVAAAISSISCAHGRDSATRPCVRMLLKSPKKIGASASRRSSDFANASAGCRLVQASGVGQPLSACHAKPRRVRNPSSLESRSDDRGRVEIRPSAPSRWEMASVRAIRFNASSPAACQSGMAASARPASVR